MNRHFIIGNLVRDPETGTTPNGHNYTRFTVAVNRRNAPQGAPEAEFIQVTCWRGLAESCAKYLRKGRKVAVEGESVAHGWVGQKGEARAQIQMTASEVEFCGGGQGSGNSAPQEPGWMNDQGGNDAQAGTPDENGYTQVSDVDQPW